MPGMVYGEREGVPQRRHKNGNSSPVRWQSAQLARDYRYTTTTTTINTIILLLFNYFHTTTTTTNSQTCIWVVPEVRGCHALRCRTDSRDTHDIASLWAFHRATPGRRSLPDHGDPQPPSRKDPASGRSRA